MSLTAVEPVEGTVLAPDEREREAFGLGYRVGQSVRDAEDAAAAVFARARRRQLVLDAIAVGAGWFLGSLIAERSAR